MKVNEFYAACEEILGVETEYKENIIHTKIDRETGEEYKPSTKATRWGGREPGNGRFPGRGLIRVFGSVIHFSLNDPKMIGTFNSFEDALKALEKVMNIERKIPEIGDEINVYIMGEYQGKGTIVGEYDDDQWIVSFEITYPSGYKSTIKRYIDKTP